MNEVGATFELLCRVQRADVPIGGVIIIERILAGQALIERECLGRRGHGPSRSGSIRLAVVIVIRRQVTASAATALNLIILGDRNVEIDDADALIGPQQVGGLTS